MRRAARSRSRQCRLVGRLVIGVCLAAGPVSLSMADDEKTVRGKDEIAAKARDKQTKAPIASHCDPEKAPLGKWITDFGEISFPAEARRRIDAPYTHNNGRLFGTLTGRVFSGEWVQSASDSPCSISRHGSPHWGAVELRFNEAFNRFTGVWNYCGKTAGSDKKWSGYRDCSGSCTGKSLVINGKEVCPEKLPDDGKLGWGEGWVGQLSGKRWEEARRAECTCRTVTLGYVRTRMYNEDRETFTTSIQYDFWNASKPPRAGTLAIPELNWHPGRVFPRTDRPDRVCFQFTFPKALAYLRPVLKDHPCEVQVKLHYPREIRGAQTPYTIVHRLYSAMGAGGTMNQGSALFAAGTDGRSVLANEICVLPVNRDWKIGPSGKTGYIEWTVRGARELTHSAPQETCARINFAVR